MNDAVYMKCCVYMYQHDTVVFIIVTPTPPSKSPSSCARRPPPPSAALPTLLHSRTSFVKVPTHLSVPAEARKGCTACVEQRGRLALLAVAAAQVPRDPSPPLPLLTPAPRLQ